MRKRIGVIRVLKLVFCSLALASATLPLTPDAEAAGGGSNGRDILFIPISWCAVEGSPAEANPNILGLDGILDNTTDAILWRRHERPTNAIFLPQADIQLRSAINDIWGDFSFPIIADPTTAVGVRGDVSGWDVNFDGAEFNQLINNCHKAYEEVDREDVGITAVNINLFHDGGRPEADGDLDGLPDGDTVMDYYPVIGWGGCTSIVGTTECAQPYDGRFMVPDNYYFYPTNPDRTFPSSPHDPAGDLQYPITDSLDLITGHEVGLTLGLMFRSDNMALMNTRPVDNVGGDDDVDNIKLNSAEITTLRSNALIVVGTEIDPLGQFDPGAYVGQRRVDLGIEPLIASYLNITSVKVALERVGTSIYFNQYLNGLLPTDGGELSFAILTDLDTNSVTGCAASDLQSIGVDNDFPGAEMVALLTLSDMTIISSAAYFCASDGTMTQADPDVFGFEIQVLRMYPFFSPLNNQTTVPQVVGADVHHTINLWFDNTALSRPIAVGAPFRLQAVTMQDGEFTDDLDGRMFQINQPSFPHCSPQADVSPGGTVAVAYDGLLPNTEIHVFLGPQLVLDGVFTDMNGAGTVQMPIPVNASEGLTEVTIGHTGLALTADCAVNVVVPCEEGEFPVCGGDCPDNFACKPSAAGAEECVCEPLLCNDSAPTCGGVCPQDQQCGSFTDPQTGELLCQCEPILCEQSDFPVCGGECPADSACKPSELTGECACEPIRCEESEFPVCGGECPADSACTPSAATGQCVCEPILCEQSEFPVCGGECPQDSVCFPDEAGGACVCRPVECGQSQAPQCGGICPAGTACASFTDPAGTLGCECVIPPTPCGQTQFPMCGGVCPDFSQCEPDRANGVSGGAALCGCQPCDTVVPAGDITIEWISKITFRWTGLECADRYNVYRSREGVKRLTDADSDNLADDYGSCFLADLLITEADDASDPLPGFFHHYLVTGESAVGEGDLMTNSFGMTRPNNNPCP